MIINIYVEQNLTNNEKIALQFNDCINNQDLEGLSELMTDDHLFIDSANDSIKGKSANISNWTKFFELFPDYCNVFTFVTSRDFIVIMIGYSICSNKILNNKNSIWTAKIKNNKLKEWRVWLDTSENRKKLEI